MVDYNEFNDLTICLQLNVKGSKRRVQKPNPFSFFLIFFTPPPPHGISHWPFSCTVILSTHRSAHVPKPPASTAAQEKFPPPSPTCTHRSAHVPKPPSSTEAINEEKKRSEQEGIVYLACSSYQGRMDLDMNKFLDFNNFEFGIRDSIICEFWVDNSYICTLYYSYILHHLNTGFYNSLCSNR